MEITKSGEREKNRGEKSVRTAARGRGAPLGRWPEPGRQ